MIFNSLTYAIFLPIVFFLYWLLPHKCRWILLLIASYYFYMSWNPKYVILILGTTVVSYGAAILLERARTEGQKKIILAATAVVCLGVLFVFKYLNFTIMSVCQIFDLFAIHLSPVTVRLLLPVGISFYTFQTLSYVIDVYRGKVSAEKHFGYYAVFVSFFPQLVAGPIERTANLLPQIKSRKTFREEQALDGVKFILWGLFKKLVIADMLGSYVDRVYGDLHAYRGFALVIAAFFFSIQIYSDFSGYSNIAIGSAGLLGIDLMDNFRSPYFAKSVRDFWSRWHISLSTWFRDYVYIPLGGSRCGKLRHSFNLMVTFMVSGLWHGADWTFVVWGGGVHGMAQLAENAVDGCLNIIRKNVFGRLILWVLVFGFCNVAWVFFRADSIADALYVFLRFPDGIKNPFEYLYNGFTALGIGSRRFIYIAVMIFFLAVVDFFSYKTDVIAALKERSRWMQWLIYLSLALLVVLFAQKGEPAEFVYFQF